ncbi:LacI family DNA-binding transcriptional regulator [Modestobacter marinus]|uniref:LacI family DNA-binding transcriptional regulator n=1 Tax=Modestobacter marinus TaxID=477641 RepID=UPI001C985669|nr:LacI family DNA-binding transcriptional regulator [Modestobacter marinus]
MAGGRATVRDVARRAGVSTATVSRTVTGTAHVSAETLDRVRTAIAELDFHPSAAARDLRRRRTGNIGLVTPSIVNPFFPELVAGVHAEVSRRGWSLLVVDSDDPEREAARVAGSRLVDGVLLVASEHSARRVPGPPGPVPVVAFDRAPAPAATAVQCDNVAGAAAVVEHLIGLGHVRIAHLAGPRGLDVAEQRAERYRRALAAHGVPLDGRLVRGGVFTEDSGHALTAGLLADGVRPTAVFAANDVMAVGAIAALRDHGLRVPADVSVAGFDGIHLGRYLQPPLTTYAQPVTAIARHAVDLLLDAVESAPPAGRTRRAPVRTHRLPGALVVRGSTAAAPARTPPPPPRPEG